MGDGPLHLRQVPLHLGEGARRLRQPRLAAGGGALPGGQPLVGNRRGRAVRHPLHQQPIIHRVRGVREVAEDGQHPERPAADTKRGGQQPVDRMSVEPGARAGGSGRQGLRLHHRLEDGIAGRQRLGPDGLGQGFGGVAHLGEGGARDRVGMVEARPRTGLALLRHDIHQARVPGGLGDRPRGGGEQGGPVGARLEEPGAGLGQGHQPRAGRQGGIHEPSPLERLSDLARQRVERAAFAVVEALRLVEAEDQRAADPGP